MLPTGSFTIPFRELFGLTLQIDAHPDGRHVASPAQPADVRILLLNSTPLGVESTDWRLQLRDPDVAIEDLPSGEWVRITYRDGPAFAIATNRSEVRASWSAPTTFEDVTLHLLGPVLGLLLYVRGCTCLHASAVAYRGKALVFAGVSEAGKSTLVAAFARIGHRVLTDDILVVDRTEGSVVAKPGIPTIGLWPQSVEHLGGHEDALPRRVPASDRRYFDLASHGLFQDAALPVGAVYILSDRESNAALRIAPLVGNEAVLALIANKYVTRFSERKQDGRDFVLLSELSTSVPIRRITRNDALSDLNATCEAILADYDALALAPA